MAVFRLALATAVLTFALLVVGGFVHPTGSSLACPDWPLCYGQVFPEMEGGVFYEHSHRLVAGFVAALTAVLAVATFRVRRQRRPRGLAVALVATVLVQAVLGGLTVLLRLPMLVSAAHLAVSMVFFLLTLEACFLLAPPAPAAFAGRPARGPALVALAATYVQLVLGGFVRHSGAGAACGDEVPLCGGVLWPSLPASQVHQAHRLFGVVVAVLVTWAAVVSWREARRHGRSLAAGAALAAPVLVVAQVAIGVLTVLSHVGVAQVVAHLAVAALLLADLYVLLRGLAPAPGPATADDARPFAAAGAYS